MDESEFDKSQLLKSTVSPAPASEGAACHDQKHGRQAAMPPAEESKLLNKSLAPQALGSWKWKRCEPAGKRSLLFEASGAALLSLRDLDKQVVQATQKKRSNPLSNK